LLISSTKNPQLRVFLCLSEMKKSNRIVSREQQQDVASARQVQGCTFGAVAEK